MEPAKKTGQTKDSGPQIANIHQNILANISQGLIRKKRQSLTVIEDNDSKFDSKMEEMNDVVEIPTDNLLPILQRQKKTFANARQIFDYVKNKQFFHDVMSKIDAEQEHEAAMLLLKNVKYEKYKAGQVLYYKEDRDLHKMYYVYKGQLASAIEREETQTYSHSSEMQKSSSEGMRQSHEYKKNLNRKHLGVGYHESKSSQEKTPVSSVSKNNNVIKLNMKKAPPVNSKQEEKTKNPQNSDKKLSKAHRQTHQKNDQTKHQPNPLFLLNHNESESLEKKIVWIPNSTFEEDSFVGGEFLRGDPYRMETMMAKTDVHLVIFLSGTFEFVKTRYNRHSARIIDMITRYFPSKESNEETFITRILKCMTTKELTLGNYVYVENVVGHEFFMIHEGSCELQKQAEGTAKPTSICVMTSGTLLGDEILFLEDQKYIFSVKVASASCIMMIFDQEKFLSLFPKRIFNQMRESFDHKFLANLQMYHLAMASSAAYQKNNLIRFADTYFKTRQRPFDGNLENEEDDQYDDPVKFLLRHKKEPDPMQKYYRYQNRNFRKNDEEKALRLAKGQVTSEISSMAQQNSVVQSSKIVTEKPILEKSKTFKILSAPTTPRREISFEPESRIKNEEVSESRPTSRAAGQYSQQKMLVDLDLDNEFRDYFRKIIVRKQDEEKERRPTPPQKIVKSLLPGFPDRIPPEKTDLPNVPLYRSAGIKKGVDIFEFQEGTNTVIKLGNFKTSDNIETFAKYVKDPENFRLLPSMVRPQNLQQEEKPQGILAFDLKKKWVSRIDVLNRLKAKKYIQNKFLGKPGNLMLRSSSTIDMRSQDSVKLKLEALRDIPSIQSNFENGEISMRDYLNSFRKKNNAILNARRGEALIYEESSPVRRTNTMISKSVASSPLKSIKRDSDKASPLSSFQVTATPFLSRYNSNSRLEFFLT